MRSLARQKLGYFQLALAEAERIRRFLVFPGEETSVLDLEACCFRCICIMKAAFKVFRKVPYGIDNWLLWKPLGSNSSLPTGESHE
jgi:hypothetical protein